MCEFSDAIAILQAARANCKSVNYRIKLGHAIDYLRNRSGYRHVPRVSLRKSVLCSTPRGRRFMSLKGAL